MREDRDEDGTWWAHAGGREVWFAAFSRKGPEQRKPTVEQLLSEVTEHGAARTFTDEGGGRVAAAALREREGVWLLTAAAEVPGHLAVATLVLASGEDLDWALDAWRSLRYAERGTRAG
jgi:hypothetical protein